jgi:hypothetical protein
MSWQGALFVASEMYIARQDPTQIHLLLPARTQNYIIGLHSKLSLQKKSTLATTEQKDTKVLNRKW